MRHFQFLIYFSLINIFNATALAQVQPTLGIAPNTTYHNFKVDNVNLKNGNVAINIPLFTLPQGGGFKPVTYFLTANTGGWTATPTCAQAYECTYAITSPDPVTGVSPSLGPKIVSDSPFEGFQTGGTTGRATYYVDDEGYPAGTYQWSIVDSTQAIHPLVYNNSDLTELRTVDGSGYRMKFNSGEAPYDPYYYASNYSTYAYNPLTAPMIYDRNGISSVVSQSGTSFGTYAEVQDTNGNHMTSYEDSMGRTMNGLSSMDTSTGAIESCPMYSSTNTTQQTVGASTWAAVNTYGTSTPDPRYTFKICYAKIHYHTDLWQLSSYYDPGINYFQEYIPSGDDNNNPDENEGGGTLYTEAYGWTYVIQSVTLPDGTYWGFTYNSAPETQNDSVSTPVFATGLITQIHEPAGGNISYCYGIYQYIPFSNAQYDQRGETEYIYPPVLNARTESASGNSPYAGQPAGELISDATGYNSAAMYSFSGNTAASCSGSGWNKWAYSISPVAGYGAPTQANSNLTIATAQVTDPQGNVSSYNFSMGGETSRTINQGASTSLQQIVSTVPVVEIPTLEIPYTQWQFTALVTGEQTYLNGSQVGSTSYGYTGSFTGAAPFCELYTTSYAPSSSCNHNLNGSVGVGTRNSTAIYNSASTLLKSTTTQFESDTNNTYWNANLLDLPYTVVASDGTNSATTTYYYDQSTYVSTPLTGGSGYGHLTTTTDATGVSTHTYWTTYGMVDHVVDGRANSVSLYGTPVSYTPVQYSYDSTTHMLPITKTYPDGANTYSYDLTSNAINWSKDFNSNQTSNTYDSIGRLTAVQYPDAGNSSQSQVYCYPTSTTVWKMTAKTTPLSVPASSSYCTSPSSWGDSIVQEEVVDGFGRILGLCTQSGLSPVEVDTTYDSVDNVYSVSNPYYASSSSCGNTTSAVTTQLYDALARPTTETNPDSSIESWTYSGLSTTVTDDYSSAGSANLTTLTKDMLGRLTDAYEPMASGSSPGTLHTNYAYNVFGLTNVTQSGNGSEVNRTRSFRYDALSRLVCASNPENSTAVCSSSATSYTGGTTGYAYDNNSNVITKTDARGIATGYAYDPSNRLLSKAFSSVPAGMLSLSSCYKYDSAVNGLGKLGTEWTTSSACSSTVPSSGFTTKRAFLAYDKMGRIWNEQQCTTVACSSGPTPPCSAGYNSPYYQTYCYDLAGNTVWSVNGVSNVSIAGVASPITFNSTYDSAGHLSTLSTNSWSSDSLHPPSLFTADPNSGYTAAGAIQNIFLGNYIYVNKTYDSRLRTTGETAIHP